jgi:arylsulfatase A-like enzyme
MPTICEAAGVKTGRVDGLSLAPLLRGESLRARQLHWHYPHYSNQGGEPGSAIRDGDWKLIEFHVDGRRELFHLRDDPGETVNLVARHPQVTKSLASKLESWRKSAGAIFPKKNPDADPNWPGFQLTGEEKPSPAAR